MHDTNDWVELFPGYWALKPLIRVLTLKESRGCKLPPLTPSNWPTHITKTGEIKATETYSSNWPGTNIPLSVTKFPYAYGETAILRIPVDVCVGGLDVRTSKYPDVRVQPQTTNLAPVPTGTYKRYVMGNSNCPNNKVLTTLIVQGKIIPKTTEPHFEGYLVSFNVITALTPLEWESVGQAAVANSKEPLEAKYSQGLVVLDPKLGLYLHDIGIHSATAAYSPNIQLRMVRLVDCAKYNAAVTAGQLKSTLKVAHEGLTAHTLCRERYENFSEATNLYISVADLPKIPANNIIYILSDVDYYGIEFNSMLLGTGVQLYTRLRGRFLPLSNVKDIELEKLTINPNPSVKDTWYISTVGTLSPVTNNPTISRYNYAKQHLGYYLSDATLKSTEVEPHQVDEIVDLIGGRVFATLGTLNAYLNLPSHDNTFNDVYQHAAWDRLQLPYYNISLPLFDRLRVEEELMQLKFMTPQLTALYSVIATRDELRNAITTQVIMDTI